jgi:NhaA family Na+:H+ antiporter
VVDPQHDDTGSEGRQRGPRSSLRHFLKSKAAGGALLMAAAVAAMVVANSAAAPFYFAALHAYVGPLSVLHWINDAAMAVFFLLVGLEIKREFVSGHMAKWSERALPMIAAAAGMAAPAIVYLAVVRDDLVLTRGWAIPSATDIAFAIGVIALLGKRVPVSLKLLLTTVAIADDMGAVMIIALVYTAGLSLPALAAAFCIFALMVALNRLGIRRLWPYLLLSVSLWIAVFLSGVHATVAGVLTAMVIPSRGAAMDSGHHEKAPLHRLEHALEPWVAFAVVPLFGFANAGVSLAGIGLAQILEPLPLGIATGLFIGKQAGIYTGIRIAVGCGIAARPTGASWAQVYGIALLCGIGFTMSLFIGSLAFPDPTLMDDVKIGVLMGSVVSACAGYLLLRANASGDAA